MVWNTRNANPAKKSRELSKPAMGLSVNPVQSECKGIKLEKNKHYLFTQTSQIIGNIFELRDVVLAKATVLDHQWEYAIVLFAGMSGEQLDQFTEHQSPCLGLRLSVLDTGNGLAT